MREMSFRGQSGKAYKFTKMAESGPWARCEGLALFAARGPFGLRVVKLSVLRNRAHDIQPIWAFADAQRYGASEIYVMQGVDEKDYKRIFEDLLLGLSPVCETIAPSHSLAA